ncbi:MAG: aminotransferase class IV [Arachnia sp.]
MQQLVARLGVGVCEDGFISADDLGLNRGDGCFDATLVRVDGTHVSADFVDEHLDRLANSARLLGMAPVDQGAWHELTTIALAAWAERAGNEAVCKFVCTRGQESVAGAALGLITVTELSAARIAAREAATAVSLNAGRAASALQNAPWLLGGAKSLSYGTNLAFIREAHRQGVTDAVMVATDGVVLEGPQSGIIVARDGVLTSTPVSSTGILDSITVRHVFDGWRGMGRQTEHRLYGVEELVTADAAWFASSIRGLTPILELDGRKLTLDPALTSELRALIRP